MMPFVILFPILYALLRSFTLLTKHFYSLTNNKRVWKTLNGKYVLITNAVTEFDENLCLQLAKKNIRLILLGTNETKLLELRAKLSHRIEVHHHFLDMYHQKDFSFLDKYDIGLVINKIGSFTYQPEYFIDQNIDTVVDTYFKAPMNLIKTIMATMAEKHRGYILNIGFNYSIKPSPQYSVVSSIKAAFKSWSESMYYEMMPYNITVEYMEIGNLCFAEEKYYRQSFLIPEVKKVTKSVIETLGSSYFTVPYYSHFIVYIFIFITPRFIVGRLRSFRNESINQSTN